MKSNNKEQILKLANEKTAEEIARELGIKERKVRKILEQHKEKTSRETTHPLKAKTPAGRRNQWIAVVLIVLLGFTVYANSLDGEFIWDDRNLVKNNTFIKDWSNIPKILTTSLGEGAGNPQTFYRPLQLLTYMVEYSFWGLDVRGYHLGNIFYHVLAALAIFWFVKLLYDDWLLSLLTGLLFVVHPFHTEAVAYISGRADSLITLFVLLTIIFYIKHDRQKNVFFYVTTLLCYMLALLSKESSLILPVLLLIYHYCQRRKIRPAAFLPVIVMALTYVFLRFFVLASSQPDLERSSTLLDRVPGFLVAITNYVRITFLPLNLHMEYGNTLFTFTDPRALAGLLILAAGIVYAVRKRKERGLVVFCALWIGATLLPSSNLVPINAYMAEHWLYLPSVGIFLLLARFFSTLIRDERFKATALTLIIFLIGFFAVRTVQQNNYWDNPMSFYMETLKYAPDSPRLNNIIGLTYNAQGQHQEAVPFLEKAIAVSPKNAKAYNNLAIAYIRLGREEEAVLLLEAAIKLEPDHAKPYNTLAAAYNKLGKTDEAIAVFKKAIAIYPGYPEARYNLANTYQNLDRTDEAIPLLKEAVALKPDYAKAYYSLAVIYVNSGQFDLAIEYYDRAKALGVASPEMSQVLEPYR